MPNARLLDLIGELRQLLPGGAIWPQQVVGEIAAIAVRNGRQNGFTVARSLERDLGDPRKIFAHRVGVARLRCSEFVKINLLIEV